MAEYLYILRGGEYGERSPEQMQQTMQKWQSWMKELGQKVSELRGLL